MNAIVQRYFTMEVLQQVMEGYTWPATYSLEDNGAGEVVAVFPACTLVFVEGFASDMEAYFLNSQLQRTDTQSSLTVWDAVQVVKPLKLQEPGFVPPVGIEENLPPIASLPKVITGLHHLCMALQTYLLPYLEGDFSWVEAYNKNNDWDRPLEDGYAGEG